MSDSFRRIDEILRRIFENPDNFENLEKLFTEKFFSKSIEGDNIKLNFMYVKENENRENDEKSLQMELQEVIESENFERAIEIRDELKKLEMNKLKLKNLEIQLKQSIDKQDFEKCIVIRDEINKLRTK